jgi:1-acyl-sn-glycerol-3-phosphate acyltransferase
MRLTQRLVEFLVFVFVSLTCRVHDEGIEDVPGQGPLILLINHVNFLEVPVLYHSLRPRRMTALVKRETWNNPFLGFLFSQWETIPISRGTVDRQAFKQGLTALKNGIILALSPEGTRSGSGRLQSGHSGVVYMALHSGAPLQPLVFYGGEHFWKNIRRLKKTDFHICVGRPFYVDGEIAKPDRALRNEITVEIMYQMASLLPPEYRGEYHDLELASQNYIVFAENNFPVNQ